MPCPLHFHIFHTSFCKYKCLLSMKAHLFFCCRTEFWITSKIFSSAEIRRDKKGNRIFQFTKCTFAGCPVQIRPYTGGNKVAATLQAGQMGCKTESACFRQGQEKVVYTSWLMYIWQGRRRLHWNSTFLSCRCAQGGNYCWGNCYAMLYGMRRSLEPESHQMIDW